MALAALAPSLGLELAALTLAGAASIAFMATGNSTLQLNAAPSMRGRVMSLWFVAFQGSTPIGGPIVGWFMAVLARREARRLPSSSARRSRWTTARSSSARAATTETAAPTTGG